MRYDAYRARGMQVGSGQIESSCKQMVVTRFSRGRDANGRCAARMH